MIYYVCATNGKIGNDGTLESPFLTIQTAAELALPGDNICVLPGIYRERVCPPRSGEINKPIVYKSLIDASGNRAIVRGSCIWKPTTNQRDLHPNVWSGILDNSLFTDSSHIDGGCPFDVLSSVTPYGFNGLPEFNMKESMTPIPDPSISYCLGQVFVSNEMYVQVTSLQQLILGEKTWFYQSPTRTLFIHYPSNCDVNDCITEITNQRRLFAPHKRGLKYISVTGFVFERCGNNYPNQFWVIPQNQQAGAVGTRSGRFWTIDNNIIRYANGVGIDWGNEGSSNQDLEIGSNGLASGAYGHIITNNEICDNGAAGTASYMCKKFTFSYNIVMRNNLLKFYGKRRWESAGLKVHCPADSVIQYNKIQDNYCHGIWCDQGISNGIFERNELCNNQGSGINIEIGKGTSGKIRQCNFNNNECGISLVTSGGVLIEKNTFIYSQKVDIQTILFNRTADKWDSDNVFIYSNSFGKSPLYMMLTPKDLILPSNRYLNNNIYLCKSDEKKFVLGKTSYHYNDWVKQWNAMNGDKDYDENSMCM